MTDPEEILKNYRKVSTTSKSPERRACYACKKIWNVKDRDRSCPSCGSSSFYTTDPGGIGFAHDVQAGLDISDWDK